jgi:hypothetical protein
VGTGHHGDAGRNIVLLQMREQPCTQSKHNALCQRFRVDRGNIDIQEATLTIVGATQPSEWRDSIDRIRANGFANRFVASFGTFVRRTLDAAAEAAIQAVYSEESVSTECAAANVSEPTWSTVNAVGSCMYLCCSSLAGQTFGCVFVGGHQYTLLFQLTVRQLDVHA